jgi:hypothetical protein
LGRFWQIPVWKSNPDQKFKDWLLDFPSSTANVLPADAGDIFGTELEGVAVSSCSQAGT